MVETQRCWEVGNKNNFVFKMKQEAVVKGPGYLFVWLLDFIQTFVAQKPSTAHGVVVKSLQKAARAIDP